MCKMNTSENRVKKQLEHGKCSVRQMSLRWTFKTDQQTFVFESFYKHRKYLLAKQHDEESAYTICYLTSICLSKLGSLKP